MKYKRRKGFSFNQHLLEASLARVKDNKTVSITNAEIQKEAIAYLKLHGDSLKAPELRPGDILNSVEEQTYLKDFKYHVNLLNLKTNALEHTINRNTIDVSSTIKEMQRELVGLLSEVIEEETKILGKYSKVHFNSFTRSIDMPLGYEDQKALKDYKTGFGFNQKYLMEVLNNAGLTLPVKGKHEIPILDAYIVDEYTDAGDTQVLLQNGDPKNLIRNNKLFRYSIIRMEGDHTSRLFKPKTSFDEYPYNCVSTLTIELEMPNLVMVNYLSFTPVGDSTIRISENDGLTYKNEGGEEISLNSISIPSETSTTLLFQPIHCKYLRIKFEQTGTVGRKEMIVQNQKEGKINELLKNAGWHARLPYKSDKVMGRVYDFSLSDISVGLQIFENKGIFRSGTPVKVDNPIGFDFLWSAEYIEPVEKFDTYLKNSIMPDGSVMFENYIYAKLYGGTNIDAFSKGNALTLKNDSKKETLILDEVIPIPDSYPIQKEFLEPIIDNAKVKLYPDTTWNLNSLIVENVTLKGLNYRGLGSEVDESYYMTNGVYDISNILINETNLINFNVNFENIYSALKLGLNQAEEWSFMEDISMQEEFLPTVLTQENFDQKFDASNSVHAKSRALLEKAIKETVSSNRPDFNKTLEWLLKNPDEKDLEYIFGSDWHKADESLKLDMTYNVKDYLFLNEDIIWGTNKYWKNNSGKKTASIFARVRRLPLNREYGLLHRSIQDTFIVALDIESIDSSDLKNQELIIENLENEILKLKNLRDYLNSEILYIVGEGEEINNNEDEEEWIEIHELKSRGYSYLEIEDLLNEEIKRNENDLNLAVRKLDLINNNPVDFESVTCSLRVVKKPEDLVDVSHLSIKHQDQLKATSLIHSKATALAKDLRSEISVIKEYEDEHGLNWPSNFEGSSGGGITWLKKFYNERNKAYAEFFASLDINAVSLYKVPKFGFGIFKTRNIDYASWISITGPKGSSEFGPAKFAANNISSWKNFNINILRKNLNNFVIGEKINESKLLNNVFSRNDFDTQNATYFRLINGPNSFIAKLANNSDWEELVAKYRDKICVTHRLFNSNKEWWENWFESPSGQNYASEAIRKMVLLGSIPNPCWKFKTKVNHNLAPGDIISFNSKPYNILTGDYYINAIIDNKTFSINLSKQNIDFMLPSEPDFYLGGVGSEKFNEKKYESFKNPTAVAGGELLWEWLENWVKSFNPMISSLDWSLSSLVEDLALASIDSIEREKADYLFLALLKGDVGFPIMNFNGSSVNLYNNDILKSIMLGLKIGGSELRSLRCYKVGYQPNPLDVFENDVKLTIGEDYYISFNEGADLLGFYPTNSSYSSFWKNAKAGNFVIKLKRRDPSKIYWTKYRVAKNQSLSETGYISLKNGRIVCNDILRNTSGFFHTVILARTNSLNPYVTPLLRDYSLRIQEVDSAIKHSGKLKEERLNVKRRRSNYNVS